MSASTARGALVVEAVVENALVSREAERHDADVDDALPRIRPLERIAQNRPVVDPGHENDLACTSMPASEKAVERGDAVRRVLADKRAASRRIARMQRYAQRGDALLDDARLVFHREIRQGDERARQKAQAEIVVAQQSEGRMCAGSCLMKQNVQALRQSFTRSNSTPSKAKPQSSPSSRSSSTTPRSPSRSM